MQAYKTMWKREEGKGTVRENKECLSPSPCEVFLEVEGEVELEADLPGEVLEQGQRDNPLRRVHLRHTRPHTRAHAKRERRVEDAPGCQRARAKEERSYRSGVIAVVEAEEVAQANHLRQLGLAQTRTSRGLPGVRSVPPARLQQTSVHLDGSLE